MTGSIPATRVFKSMAGPPFCHKKPRVSELPHTAADTPTDLAAGIDGQGTAAGINPEGPQIRHHVILPKKSVVLAGEAHTTRGISWQIGITNHRPGIVEPQSRCVGIPKVPGSRIRGWAVLSQRKACAVRLSA